MLFRASSGQGASQALQDLSHDAGLPYLGFGEFLGVKILISFRIYSQTMALLIRFFCLILLQMVV